MSKAFFLLIYASLKTELRTPPVSYPSLFWSYVYLIKSYITPQLSYVRKVTTYSVQKLRY
jgi:hypothetical protein